MNHILSDKTLERFVKFGVNVMGVDASLPPYEIARKAIDGLYAFFEKRESPCT